MTVTQHRYVAYLTMYGGMIRIPLSIKSGSVRLNVTRWPHVTGELVVALSELGVLDELDPRRGRRVLLLASETTFAQSRQFNLGIRKIRPSREASEVLVELASDEAMLEDYGPLEPDTGAREYQASLRGVVSYVLAKIGARLEPGGQDFDVTAYWGVTNQLPNPSAELDAASWLDAGGANNITRLNLTTAPAGGYVIRWTSAGADSSISPSGAATGYSVAPGRSMVFSAYVMTGVAGRTAALQLRWLNNAGDVVGTTSGSALTTTTAFQRMHVIGTAPAGASNVLPVINIIGGVTGNYFYTDAAMLHEGVEVVPYFDGAKAPDSGYRYQWQAAIHASASSRVPHVERDPEIFTWPAGYGGVTFLAPLLQAHGLRLVCDEERLWTLRDADYFRPGVVTLTEGSNIVTIEESSSRDDEDWFDGLVMEYRWTDRYGIEQTRLDAYAVPGAGKIIRRQLEAVYPGPGRAQYAVERARGKGRLIKVKTVANWDTQPEQRVVALLGVTPRQEGDIESVKFDFTTDRMTITSRTLDIPDGAIDLLDGTIDGLVGTIDDL